MKKLILTTLFVFSALITAQAQTVETVGVLQPPPKIQKIKKSDKKKLAAPSLDNPDLDFDPLVDLVNLTDSATGLAVTINISNREIVFEDKDDTSEAYLNILVRVLSLDGNSGIFEEKLIVKLNKSQKEEAMKASAIYRKIIELPAGQYKGRCKIDIVVRDTKSGNKGIRSIGVDISDSNNRQNAGL